VKDAGLSLEARRSLASKRRFMRPREGWRHHLACYVFVAPYLVAFVVFVGLPVLYGLYVSLHNWNAVGGNQGFVGAHNYTTLFDAQNVFAQYFWTGIVNTVLFAAISVPVIWALATMLAYAVYTYHGTLKSFFRSLYFLPTVFSAAAIGALWQFLLATDGGSINNFFGVHVQWLTSQPWAWISLDLASVWWTVGFFMLIMYAGINEVPRAVFEASALDGAGWWRTFVSIVLPQIQHVSLVVIVIATIQAFNLFAQPLIMTNGGPGTSTRTISMVIYDQIFNSMDAGGGAAMAYLFGILLAALVFVQYFRGARLGSRQ